MHQVLERHVPGQAFVNAARQVAHLGQLFEQDALPLLFILPGGVGLGRILAHVAGSRFPVRFVDVLLLLLFFWSSVWSPFPLTSFSRFRAATPQRSTPNDCTSTSGGTSRGESTTTFGKKGSSSRCR